MLKRKDFIKAIIGNAAVLLLALVFFTFSVFAWFRFINYESETEHHINVGSFKVDIRDNDESSAVYTDQYNINLENMYPMTVTEAYIKKYINKQIYRFDVVNKGTVPAMYRFVVTATDKDKQGNVISDSVTPRLSQQLKYSLIVDRDYAFLYEEYDIWYLNPNIPEDQYVFGTMPNIPSTNTSLQKCLDSVTVTLSAGEESFNTTYGEIKQGESVYFSICFWLSDQAIFETAAKKSTTITLKAFFMQSVGNDKKWDPDWQTWGT